ncbi:MULTISPECIES: YcaO-like family protein [Pseudomonas syringae group genomosp. 2]|nr:MULTISPECIES: YcaO-like family protein [Pseudomonas syringae group genomosp. 2]MCQ3007930.1 YcaO-like family protein [Pseudomonas savastanoi]
MINITQPSGSNWPSNFMLTPQIARGLPALAQAFDHHRVAPTSAVGTPREAICGTVGEFMERRHFYNEVVPEQRRTISEMMPPDAADAYIAALRQTAQVALRPSIASHQFSCNEVFNLFSHSPCYAPTVFISLSNYNLQSDQGYLPNRDTTGCAVHLRLESAIDGAIKELIERQCLLRYWMTKQVKQEIVITDELEGLNQDTRVLIQKLRKTGSLKLYEITIPGFPGYAVMSLYGADDEALTVQYCTGLSYGFSATSAIDKSIVELWQSFAFLHYFKVGGYDINDIDDSYHRHFWECNKRATFTLMTEEEPLHEIFMPDFLAQPEIIRSDLERHLLTITKNIFFYAKSESLNGALVWFVRVFSPDFFIHMDCSSPLNHKNSIAAEFPVVYADRSTHMVPFP